MITISLTQALALYAGVIGLGALFIFAYTEISTQRGQRAMVQQHLWRCVFCTCTYLDEQAERVSECPRCGSFNSLEDARAKFVVSHGVAEPAPAAVEQAAADPDSRRNPSRRRRTGQKRRGPRRRR